MNDLGKLGFQFPGLQFTYQIENNTSISFLNLQLIEGDNYCIITNWVRKATYSERFLNYMSNQPIQHKIGIIKHLVDATILLSDKSIHLDNIQIIGTFV